MAKSTNRAKDLLARKMAKVTFYSQIFFLSIDIGATLYLIYGLRGGPSNGEKD